MNLFNELKNLKNIRPDQEFSLRSKERILATPVLAHDYFSFMRNPRVAVATLGIVLVFGIGVARSFTSVDTASLDSRSLTAEAEAINFQIQLTDLNYAEIAEDKKAPETTTPSKTFSITHGTSSPKEIKPTSTTASDITIEEALEILAE